MNALLFLILFAWAWFQSSNITTKREDRLASKTAVIAQEKKNNTTAPADHLEPVALTPSKLIARDDNSLAIAPIDDLYETHQYGVLPKMSADWLTPFEAYKRPFTDAPGKPNVSLAIFDLGLSKKATLSAIKAMPADISLIFSPYAKSVDEYRQMARAAGHELWMSLPMESRNIADVDPGSQSLLLSASLQRNQDRLLWALSRTVGYAGIVSGYQHNFTNDTIDGNPMMEQIMGRGLGFIESNPDNINFGLPMAAQYKTPHGQNNFWIDGDLNAESIIKKFHALEAKARKEGHAVGFIRPYPVSYQIALKWVETLDQKGLQLTPLSAATNHE